MSYKSALEAAGAEVIKYQEFSSHQGDWLALVKFQNRYGWVRGRYGSCNVCDAFKSEFGHMDSILIDGKIFDYDTYQDRDATQEEVETYNAHLREFGMGYLEDIYTQEQIEKEVATDIDWDADAREMLEFVTQYSIKNLPN